MRSLLDNPEINTDEYQINTRWVEKSMGLISGWTSIKEVKQRKEHTRIVKTKDIDPNTSPEDEMRLLGNGVCPQQAAVAFQIGLRDCLKRWE